MCRFLWEAVKIQPVVKSEEVGNDITSLRCETSFRGGRVKEI